MKTELTLVQLAAIGAGAAQFSNGQALIGNLTVHPTSSGYAGDQPFREAFARAVRDAMLGSQATDPYAELKKARAKGKAIEVSVKDDECGPDRWSLKENDSWTLPPESYRVKPEPSTFEAHGKTWTKHVPGNPMPNFHGKEALALDDFGRVWSTQRDAKERRYWEDADYENPFVGWRYADEPLVTNSISSPDWTPAIGDVVQLKSGGPKMTIHFLDANNCGCVAFANSGELTFATIPQACLTLVTE